MFKMLTQTKLASNISPIWYFCTLELNLSLSVGFYWPTCSTDVKNCSMHRYQDQLAVADTFLNDTKMKAEERLGKTGKFPLCKWFRMFPRIHVSLNCLFSLSESRHLAIPVIEHPPRLSKPFNTLYGTQTMVSINYLSKF